MVRAPSAFPQAISRGVSPMTSISSAENSRPCFSFARAGKCSELVPIVVIVGEGAEFKKMPDTVMTEFELCAARDVAGEQAEHETFSRFQSFEQLEHAGKKFSFAAG